MKRAFITGILFLLVVAVAALAGAYWWLNRPLPLNGESVEVSIEAGSTPRQVAQAWTDAGVRTHPRLLFEWFRWSGESKKIRAGSYEITAGTTPIQLLNKLVRGDESLATVRLIEGWTFRQFRNELAHAESLKPTTAGLSDAELMAAL
ncbi:MAG TPA: endolytic transglycosylase MltG, partial [Burkholderiaceae bacterium]|nr:endolytic transglycosylase MltG [Burkholderiaceae bacterium]